MSIIKILAPDQALKIAAGEVIERPANMVKELLENAIDAGATRIALEVLKAGKERIKIVDNGCGMSPDDARMCFLPHATSKITSIDQLESVASFGFRGEALASISSVSKVTLSTRTTQEQVGYCLEYTEGKVVKESDVACNVGTTLCIDDLFYNVPVRKKFLKHDETEWNQIHALFQAFCLSHQSVSFSLSHQHKMVHNVPAAKNLIQRITQLWDFNFSQQLIELVHVEKTAAWLTIKGYVSQHHFWRYGKQNIFIFVNNRWIKNPDLVKAIVKGYYNVLPPGKYPAACIFITVDPSMVDINCHPKKEEVRFIKPNTVETALTMAVKKALEDHASSKLVSSGHDKIQSTDSLTDSLYDDELMHSVAEPAAAYTSSLVQPQASAQSQSLQQERLQFTPPPIFFSHAQPSVVKAPVDSAVLLHTAPQQVVAREVEHRDVDAHKIINGKIIGQLFNTYIMIDQGDTLLMIDQHAAHERILYERYMTRFEEKHGSQLLFPVVVALSKEQCALVLGAREFFCAQGIELDQIGPQEIIIKTTPPDIGDANVKEFITEAALFMQEHEALDQELFRKKLNEHVHSHMACKAAIKAGDALTVEQMVTLVRDLSVTQKRFICIHGRPTMWSIKKLELDKHFRRN